MEVSCLSGNHPFILPIFFSCADDFSIFSVVYLVPNCVRGLPTIARSLIIFSFLFPIIVTSKNILSCIEWIYNKFLQDCFTIKQVSQMQMWSETWKSKWCLQNGLVDMLVVSVQMTEKEGLRSRSAQANDVKTWGRWNEMKKRSKVKEGREWRADWVKRKDIRFYFVLEGNEFIWFQVKHLFY